jgi:hypothetical protein
VPTAVDSVPLTVENMPTAVDAAPLLIKLEPIVTEPDPTPVAPVLLDMPISIAFATSLVSLSLPNITTPDAPVVKYRSA